MGGRGGSSGVSAKGRRETFSFIEELPALTGSAEKRARAEEIRDKAMDELYDHTMNFRDARDYDVTGDDYLEAAQSGQQKSFIKNATSRARRDRREEMEKHLEENFHTVGRRIANLNELFSHKSADFWIKGNMEDWKKRIGPSRLKKK